MSIDVLFFDLDETLIAQEAAFDRAYHAVASRILQTYSQELSENAITALANGIPGAAQIALDRSPVASVVRNCCFGGRDLLWGEAGASSPVCEQITAAREKFLQDTWQTLFWRFKIEPQRDYTRVTEHFRQAMYSKLTLFPDVRASLETLSMHYRLCIVTNGMGMAQRQKMKHLDILRYFDKIVASADIGVGKPAAAYFRHALDQMNTSAETALVIGDSLAGDVQGALAAGIPATWLNREEVDDDHPFRTSLTGWCPLNTGQR